MRSHTSASRKQSVCYTHTFHILRIGFFSYQDNAFALTVPSNGVFCRKDYLANGTARSAGKPLATTFAFFSELESRMGWVVRPAAQELHA